MVPSHCLPACLFSPLTQRFFPSLPVALIDHCGAQIRLWRAPTLTVITEFLTMERIGSGGRPERDRDRASEERQAPGRTPPLTLPFLGGDVATYTMPPAGKEKFDYEATLTLTPNTHQSVN